MIPNICEVTRQAVKHKDAKEKVFGWDPNVKDASIEVRELGAGCSKALPFRVADIECFLYEKDLSNWTFLFMAILERFPDLLCICLSLNILLLLIVRPKSNQ